MFKNYLKITLRNIKKHKGYSFINIAGLAIGMACCILILLWVQDELSFDMYHKNARQIYRVSAQFGPTVEVRGAYTPPPLAEALLNEFPELQHAVRLTVWPVNRLVRFYEKSFLETNIIWADSSIFDVFTIPLIKSNPNTALTGPRSVGITEAISKKYFGNDNPICKTLNIGNRENL